MALDREPDLLIPMPFLQFSSALRIRSRSAGSRIHVQDRLRSGRRWSICLKKSKHWRTRTTGTRGARYFRLIRPTGDRIVTAQKNIQELLKAQPQYVVTTSEFDEVKARLLALENRRKNQPAGPESAAVCGGGPSSKLARNGEDSGALSGKLREGIYGIERSASMRRFLAWTMMAVSMAAARSAVGGRQEERSRSKSGIAMSARV